MYNHKDSSHSYNCESKRLCPYCDSYGRCGCQYQDEEERPLSFDEWRKKSDICLMSVENCNALSDKLRDSREFGLIHQIFGREDYVIFVTYLAYLRDFTLHMTYYRKYLHLQVGSISVVIKQWLDDL